MAQASQQISVDLDQLRATCQALSSDTEKDLKPGLSNTDLKIQQGVPFGAKSVSGEVEVARQVFASVLARHSDNFVGHVRRAEQLAEFLDVILQRYRDADDLSAEKVDVIRGLFAEALPELPPPAPTRGDLP